MLRFADPGGRMYTSVGSSNVNLLAHWTSCAASNVSVLAANGRTTGSCIRFANASNVYMQKTLDAQATWGVAFAYRVNQFGSAVLVVFRDGASGQCDLRLVSDGTLQFTRNGTVLGTSSVALNLNTWTHIEVKVTIHPSAGAFELRINGTARIGPLTSLNTRQTANSTANSILLGIDSGNSSYGGVHDWDDIVIWDTSSTDANGLTDISNFIGDCGVSWLLPSGAGTTAQFTPSTGSNYQNADDTTPNGDTDYNESSTVGQIDTYAMSDLPVGASAIKSLAVINYARKTDVGSRGMKAQHRTAGLATHATEIALADSYLYYMSAFGQDPNNGSPTTWTAAAVNALEAGQKVTS